MSTLSSFQERCGRCGFEVGGPDPSYVRERIDNHTCTAPIETKRWYGGLLSFEALSIIASVLIVAIIVFGGK